MCLIYRCLSSASAVIRSWFIYELQKSTTIAFSRNLLYTFYSRNPTCGIPPYLRISNRKYPPMPSEFHNRESPSPSEILKAVRGMVWIFSGIAHCRLKSSTNWSVFWKVSQTLWFHSIAYLRFNRLKTIPFTAAQTSVAHSLRVTTKHRFDFILSFTNNYSLQFWKVLLHNGPCRNVAGNDALLKNCQIFLHRLVLQWQILIWEKITWKGIRTSDKKASNF